MLHRLARVLVRSVVVAALGMVGASPAFGSPYYTITPLRPDFQPIAMNDSGQIVGWLSGSLTPDRHLPTSLYSNGEYTDLNAANGIPIGITSSGQPINPTYRREETGGGAHPDYTDYRTTYANSQGYQVGTAESYKWVKEYDYQTPDAGHYVQQSRSQFVLPPSGGPSYALGLPPGVPASDGDQWNTNVAGINASGLMVGGAANKSYTVHQAVIAAPGGPMVMLGDPSGKGTTGYAVNNHGDVAGDFVTAENVYHAFVYRDGKMVDLDTREGGSSSAMGINDRGEIIGSAWTLRAAIDDHGLPTQKTFDFCGALFVNGKILNLLDLVANDPGWSRLYPEMINNAGQIVAVGMRDGVGSYVLLTPIDPDATPVPEPAAWLVFGLASVAVAARSRGKI